MPTPTKVSRARAGTRGKALIVTEPASRATRSAKTKSAGSSFSAFVDDWSTSGDWGQESYDKLLRKYGHSTTWVYVGVHKNATSAAQIPIQVIKKDREGQPDAIVRVHDKGLLALLEKPNPYQSQMEFIETCVTSMDLTGNLYIEKVKAGERVFQLWPLNPSRVQILPDKDEGVRGYIYYADGKEYRLNKDDVIHVKYVNPWNEWVGLSPLTAARLAIETDRNAQEWNANFLKKGGWPGGALETDADLDDINIRRLKKEIKGQLSVGKDKAGYVLLLTGGMKYNPLAIKPKETDWLDARRMSRDEILAILGVPFAIAGIYSNESTTTRSAGVEQQIKQYYRGTVISRVSRILAAFNRDLVPGFSENFKLVPDLRGVPALNDDAQTELIRAQAFRTLVMTGVSINKALARFYPDVLPEPWGGVSWMQNSMIPISDETTNSAMVDGGPQKPAVPALPPPPKHVLLEGPLADVMDRIQKRVAAFPV